MHLLPRSILLSNALDGSYYACPTCHDLLFVTTNEQLVTETQAENEQVEHEDRGDHALTLEDNEGLAVANLVPEGEQLPQAQDYNAQEAARRKAQREKAYKTKATKAAAVTHKKAARGP